MQALGASSEIRADGCSTWYFGLLFGCITGDATAVSVQGSSFEHGWLRVASLSPGLNLRIPLGGLGFK